MPPSPPYHNAQRDPLAACFPLTKCWIYESLNEYFKEGGFTSCCGDLKCFCLAFVQTRWHWIFMICLNLQRAMQTLQETTLYVRLSKHLSVLVNYGTQLVHGNQTIMEHVIVVVELRERRHPKHWIGCLSKKKQLAIQDKTTNCWVRTSHGYWAICWLTLSTDFPLRRLSTLQLLKSLQWLPVCQKTDFWKRLLNY